MKKVLTICCFWALAPSAFAMPNCNQLPTRTQGDSEICEEIKVAKSVNPYFNLNSAREAAWASARQDCQKVGYADFRQVHEWHNTDFPELASVYVQGQCTGSIDEVHEALPRLGIPSYCVFSPDDSRLRSTYDPFIYYAAQGPLVTEAFDKAKEKCQNSGEGNCVFRGCTTLESGLIGLLDEARRQNAAASQKMRQIWGEPERDEVFNSRTYVVPLYPPLP